MAPQDRQEQMDLQVFKERPEFKAPLDFKALLEIKGFRAIQVLLGHKERRA
jgi:hypothetical protein